MPPAVRHHTVAPHPLRQALVDVHVVGCDCSACQPFAPEVTPALTCRQAAAIVVAGVGTATAISAMIDPAGTVAIVADLYRFWFLW